MGCEWSGTVLTNGASCRSRAAGASGLRGVAGATGGSGRERAARRAGAQRMDGTR